MKPMKHFLLFFFLLFFVSAEGTTPPSDTPYLKIPLTKKTDIIFSDIFKEEEPFLQSRALSVLQEYERHFQVTFYRKNFLILFSPLRRQTHSAVTHAVPLPASRISPSPFQIMDKSAVNNWLTDALIHEIAHIYQFNSRPLLSHLLSYIMPSYLWPVHPNIYFHNLILEGHAVLLESTYGTGGRLFSGYNRAVAFSQLKSHLSLKRIMNDYDNPLSKQEKYIHGGYFFSYLRRSFTLSRLNEIFAANGRNLIWPIGLYTLNRSFKKTLEQNFESLFKEYREFYGQKAREQKAATGKILAISRFALPINSNSDNLFFMISDGKSPPELAVLSRKTGEISLKTVNMPLGKIFFVDGKFYSAGYGRTDTLSIRFSLFRDGFVPLKKYTSSYVMDIRGDKVLSFNAFDGLKRQNLYLNGKISGDAHSTAVTDGRGGIWYFKQEGGNRTLYRDKAPLWTYKGYYGFPVEAEESGVYFLAPTSHGSGLFVYKNDRVFRLSPSDTIVAARRVDETNFLVCEINNDRFEYKIIPVKPFPDDPVLYKYSFKKTELEDKKDSTEDEPLAELENKTDLEKESLNPAQLKPIQPQKNGFGKGSAEPRPVKIHTTSKKRIFRFLSSEKQPLKASLKLSKGDFPTEEEGLPASVKRAGTYSGEHSETTKKNLAGEEEDFMEGEPVSELEEMEDSTEGEPVSELEEVEDSTEGEPVSELEEMEDSTEGEPLSELEEMEDSTEDEPVSELEEMEDSTEDEPLAELEDKGAKSVYYNSVLNLQIQEIAFGWGIKDFFHARERPFLYRLALTDPLSWSVLSIQGAFSQSVRRFLALYEYKRYRPAVSISWQTTDRVDKNANYLKIHYFLTGLTYPLIKTENHALSFSAIGTYKTLQKGMGVKHYFIPKVSLNFSFKRRYPFAMYNHRSFSLRLIHQNEYSFFRNIFSPSYGFKWALENELFKGFYIASQADFQTLRRNMDTLSPILLTGNQGSYSLHTSFRESGGRQGMTVKHSLITHWKLKKVIQQSFYPVSFPLALRRYAPFFGFSVFTSLNPHVTSQNQRKRQAQIIGGLSTFRFHLRYIFIGADAELSANHKALVHTGIIGGLLWREQLRGNTPSFEGGVYLKALF